MDDKYCKKTVKFAFLTKIEKTLTFLFTDIYHVK